MRIVEIDALPNGAHRNQAYNGIVIDGWAVVPDDMDTPNYPFGVVEADLVNGVMTVINWTPGIIPDTPIISEIEPGPTRLDRIEAQITYTAMMTDTLLEVEV